MNKETEETLTIWLIIIALALVIFACGLFLGSGFASGIYAGETEVIDLSLEMTKIDSFLVTDNISAITVLIENLSIKYTIPIDYPPSTFYIKIFGWKERKPATYEIVADGRGGTRITSKITDSETKQSSSINSNILNTSYNNNNVSIDQNVTETNKESNGSGLLTILLLIGFLAVIYIIYVMFPALQVKLSPKKKGGED